MLLNFHGAVKISLGLTITSRPYHSIEFLPGVFDVLYIHPHQVGASVALGKTVLQEPHPLDNATNNTISPTERKKRIFKPNKAIMHPFPAKRKLSQKLSLVIAAMMSPAIRRKRETNKITSITTLKKIPTMTIMIILPTFVVTHSGYATIA